MRAGLVFKAHADFTSIGCHRKDKVRQFDNRRRRRQEKEKLPVHHKSWIFIDEITSTDVLTFLQ